MVFLLAAVRESPADNTGFSFALRLAYHTPMTFVGLRRNVVAEIMDSPSLDEASHLRALAGLEAINRASGAAACILKSILRCSRANRLTRVTMLDVACGGGDVPVAVARAMNDGGVSVALTLFDRSPLAVRRAGEIADLAKVDHSIVAGDAVEALPREMFDFVTNSLFLHHLDKSEVVAVLQNMRSAARRAVIVSDLRRSAMGYVIAWFGCRLLSRSPVVHYDGPVSVRAAWTVEELKAMALEAGMDGVRVERVFPWRMLLTWERTDAGGGNEK